ncbi:MAG TPA: polysaccharide deacetylase family protein [Aestuariivirga sp.]
MVSSELLRRLLDGLHYSGATTLARPLFKGIGVIYCLHQVLPGGGREQGFAPNAKLECEPEFLEGLINLSRQRGFETVSLAEAVRRLKISDPKPFAVFTLDDGYKDNQQFAQPIFDRLNCPYTIFVAPRIAEGTSELWWRLLELVVAKVDRFTATIGAEAFDLATKTETEKWAAWPKLLAAVENLEQYEQRRFIRALCAEHAIDPDAYCAKVAMNWDELRTINKDPLCTIGAHTLNHHAVAKLNEADALSELETSRLIIARELGEDIQFNAYPYGDEPNAGQRDFMLAAAAGYKASVTTRKGVIFGGHAAHLQALPRIMISGRYQELRYVDALISGLPTALLNRFRQVNVA